MILTAPRYGAIALLGLLLALPVHLHAEEARSEVIDVDALILEAEEALISDGEALSISPVDVDDEAFADTAVSEAFAAIDVPVSDVSENPYGFKAAWEQSDFVSRSTFVILGIISAATWYILLVKLFEQNRLLQQSREVNRRFWEKGSLREGLDTIKPGTPFWYLADRGIKSSKHHKGQITGEVDRSTWIILSLNRAIDEIQSHLQKGLAVLATVGSTAPFVGLFGTVWGIYHALTAIGVSGQASIDKVAGPVGEALIMTALGLAVAVPAVLGYNWLVRRNKSVVESLRGFGSDLHSVLLAGSRVGEEESRASPAAASPAVKNSAPQVDTPKTAWAV